MLHHVSLPVEDLDRAIALYDAALAPLGYRRVCGGSGFAGYGVEDGKDKLGAHVPLFAILIALVASTSPRVRTASRLSIAAFLLFHGLLHAVSSGTATYEFSSTLSSLLIFGGSTFGTLYLVLEARGKLSPRFAPGSPGAQPRRCSGAATPRSNRVW